jgi:PAS domain S-box-containing protein
MNKFMTKTKVLIVEDEIITAENIRMTLNNLGYAITSIASSKEEAIHKAKEGEPDLVLMDIKLNGKMEGIEAAEQIAAQFGLPVVYLTAYADEETLKRARITEPFGYILKPFEERELHSIIEIALYKHRMEKKLRETQEWLYTTLKNIGDGVIAVDMKGSVTFMNPVAEILTGWKREEASRKDLKETFHIIHEETGQELENPITTVLREKAVVHLRNHLRLITKEHRQIPVEVSSAPIRDEKRNMVEVVLAFRDISEHKQLKEALESHKASFDNIVGKTAEGIIVVDKDGIVRFSNQKGKIYFNRKEGEFIGEKFEIPVVREESDEIEIHRSNGESGVGEVRITETEWENDPAYLVTVRDITQRKRVIRMLERSHQEQIEARDQFLSHVSHELRTPLSVIHQFVTILLDGLDGNISQTQRDDLEIILRNTNQLSIMIKDLLDLTRVITGKVTMDPRPLSVADFAEETLSSFKKYASDQGVILLSEVPAELPDVYADPIRIRQILNNLIDNAIKFTPKKGKIYIRSYAYEKDPCFICVEVKDTGCGINSLEKDEIFDYLYQAQIPPKVSRRGLGLGLFICKALVSHHGGRIWVESQPKKGSSFYFTLPVFSLEKLLAPIFIPENLRRESLSVVSVVFNPPGGRLLPKIWEQVVRMVREMVQNCIRPDSEVLLPRTGSSKSGEKLFIVACADKREADVIVRRVREQLAFCEMLKNTGITTSVSFSTIDISQVDGHKKLNHITEMITNRMAELMEENIQHKQD